MAFSSRNRTWEGVELEEDAPEQRGFWDGVDFRLDAIEQLTERNTEKSTNTDQYQNKDK